MFDISSIVELVSGDPLTSKVWVDSATETRPSRTSNVDGRQSYFFSAKVNIYYRLTFTNPDLVFGPGGSVTEVDDGGYRAWTVESPAGVLAHTVDGPQVDVSFPRVGHYVIGVSNTNSVLYIHFDVEAA